MLCSWVLGLCILCITLSMVTFKNSPNVRNIANFTPFQEREESCLVLLFYIANFMHFDNRSIFLRHDSRPLPLCMEHRNNPLGLPQAKEYRTGA